MKNIELDQYQDKRAPKSSTAAQKAGKNTIWPPPMYMQNAKGYAEYNQLCYPIRTIRQKSIVDVKDVSGDRGKGAQ